MQQAETEQQSHQSMLVSQNDPLNQTAILTLLKKKKFIYLCIFLGAGGTRNPIQDFTLDVPGKHWA